MASISFHHSSYSAPAPVCTVSSLQDLCLLALMSVNINSGRPRGLLPWAEQGFSKIWTPWQREDTQGKSKGCVQNIDIKIYHCVLSCLLSVSRYIVLVLLWLLLWTLYRTRSLFGINFVFSNPGRCIVFISYREFAGLELDWPRARLLSVDTSTMVWLRSCRGSDEGFSEGFCSRRPVWLQNLVVLAGFIVPFTRSQTDC